MKKFSLKLRNLYKRTQKKITATGKKQKFNNNPHADEIGTDFFLYSYVDEEGNFDYERYRHIQEVGNINKLDHVWVLEENIIFLSKYLKKKLGKVSFGICHGTRRGLEQKWFRKYLGADVIGTEISETATQFPHTIQWDFHEVKHEWLGKADFIYSNSFDHSYDPEKCLSAWMSCLRPGGLCIIEHTTGHHVVRANQLDPFGAHLVQMPYLITLWGKGRFGVREILFGPVKKDDVEYTAYIMVQNWEGSAPSRSYTRKARTSRRSSNG
ncbi:hypothetical protein A3F38_00100 [Candidatus Saccharibacteria bacterium RIFCSPHIGHO2_12_FULL_48_21]|nr:MAG: hypothetical protein A3F38_00100 [Candidatus Saccharibacteria bacterium RIFCSPHIGHO2_12_FULL_48_21]